MDFLSTTRTDRLRNVVLQDRPHIHNPKEFDTLTFFSSIRKALAAVDCKGV